MFRKLTIALGAAALMAAASVAVPTAASAGWHGKHHHGHHGHHGWHGGGFRVGFYGPSYAYGSGCYTVRRVYFTPYGKRVRFVPVCN